MKKVGLLILAFAMLTTFALAGNLSSFNEVKKDNVEKVYCDQISVDAVVPRNQLLVMPECGIEESMDYTKHNNSIDEKITVKLANHTLSRNSKVRSWSPPIGTN